MPRDASANERLEKNALLSPERRLQREASSSDPRFGPYAILASLERHQTAYVVIGSFARIIQGTEETSDGIDIAPSLRSGNRERLTLALSDLGVESRSVLCRRKRKMRRIADHGDEQHDQESAFDHSPHRRPRDGGGAR